MSKLIVVLGITGLQGGSVGRVFQQEPGWRVRGITRNPSKHADLAKQGIELVSADLDDQTSLEQAFEGANSIFAVTDFWQFLFDPEFVAAAEKQGKRPNEVAMEREEQHGRNIIHAAAKSVGHLDRLVISTLSDSKKWSNGEVNSNLHFDGKAHYTDYLKANFPELAKKTSYLQMGFYLPNWRQSPIIAPKKQPDGSFVMHLPRPSSGTAKAIPFVDPPNDTGPFVRALVVTAPPQTNLIGACEDLTFEEYCALWAKVQNVKCELAPWTRDAMVQNGLPDWLASEMDDMGLYVTKYGWSGGDPSAKMPGEVGVDLDQLTKVEDWMRKEDWSSVL